MSLTRDMILGAQDIETTEIDVPEWGGAVKIRAWDGATRDRFDALAMQARERGQRMPPQLRAWVAAMSICDDRGELIFSDADIAALARKSSRALDRIVERALKLNGLTPDAVDDAGKESAAARSD